MKNPSIMKMAKMAGDSRVAMKMKQQDAAMKLKKDPMKMKDPMDMKEAPMKLQTTTDKQRDRQRQGDFARDDVRKKKDERIAKMIKERKSKGDKAMKKDSAMGMKKGSAMDMKKGPMKMSEWEKALKKDPNLNKLVAARNKAKKEHGKNSKEYATAQNRVNVAYENAKRHGQTTTSESKTNKATGRTKTTTTVNTPGVGSETTTRVTGKSGDDIKTKKTTKKDSYYVPEGEKGVKTTVSKPGKDKKMDTEDDKTKTRSRKRFRDTKLGRTKIGQKFVKKENRV